MWVECESGELLNPSRADRVRIDRNYLVADVMEPEEWSLLGTICSLKGKSEAERNVVTDRLAFMRSDAVLIMQKDLFDKGPF